MGKDVQNDGVDITTDSTELASIVVGSYFGFSVAASFDSAIDVEIQVRDDANANWVTYKSYSAVQEVGEALGGFGFGEARLYIPSGGSATSGTGDVYLAAEDA